MKHHHTVVVDKAGYTTPMKYSYYSTRPLLTIKSKEIKLGKSVPTVGLLITYNDT